MNMELVIRNLVVIEPRDKNLTSISIPAGVQEIGSGAFKNCKKLDTVTIPNGVRIIRNESFRFCTSLKDIKLPENTLETIDCFAFQYCKFLKQIEIPNSVNIILDYAFDFCISLKIITLSENVEIKNNVFSNCKSLDTVYIIARDRSKIRFKKMSDKILYARDDNGENIKLSDKTKNIVSKIFNINEFKYYDKKEIIKIVFKEKETCPPEISEKIGTYFKYDGKRRRKSKSKRRRKSKSKRRRKSKSKRINF